MLDKVLKTTGLIVTITGALLTAFMITPVNIYVANVGALLYASWAWRVRDYNIFAVNVVMLAIYVSGTIYHHIDSITRVFPYVF